MKFIKSLICLLIAMGFFALKPDAARGAHFQLPFSPGPKVCDFLGSIKILGIGAEAGDEVGFFDRNGVLYGTGMFSTAGQYGYVHVYGAEGEGLKEGDPLTVRVWEAGRLMEWKNGCVVLTAGEPRGNSISSPIPPVWNFNMGYVLNIDTQTLPADVNGDCDITLADAILSLRIVSAVSEPVVSPAAAGIDGDQRIGLPEAIYILQKVAGIRN